MSVGALLQVYVCPVCELDVLIHERQQCGFCKTLFAREDERPPVAEREAVPLWWRKNAHRYARPAKRILVIHVPDEASELTYNERCGNALRPLATSPVEEIMEMLAGRRLPDILEAMRRIEDAERHPER